MRICRSLVVLLILCCTVFAGLARSEEPIGMEPAQKAVVTIKPEFLPPSEILQFLGASPGNGLSILEWPSPEGLHVVELRHNDAANLLLLSGMPDDLAFIETLVREADVLPRQIEIEVQIVEVLTSKAKDIGIDWEAVLDYSRPSVYWTYTEDEVNTELRRSTDYGSTPSSRRDTNEQETIRSDFRASASLNLASVLEILDRSGAATVRNAPRILTLNNRRATILDGQRVTYVTRYSSYTNLFEADSMDAGLTLSVLPSLGESGYITLEIQAELTSLGGEISGSPVKVGQMLDNTVIVKDGESVSLGGLTRTVEDTHERRLPLLGHVIPYLFSRKTTTLERIESYLILTPRVVDFETGE